MLGNGLSLGVGKLRDSGISFVALLEALESDGTSNIIGTPVLVTLDNEEAEIKVGQEVPFVTGSYTDTGSTGGSVNPFQTIDATGVGQLVEIAVEKGRATRPDIELGVCGEHGGDPESIHFFNKVGLDYVSCSPFRVPIARLAAAQAAIREKTGEKGGSGTA